MATELVNFLRGNVTNFTEIEPINNPARLVQDECGFVRGLRFTREHRDWIWITRVSFPLFLVVGTLGNGLAIVNVCGDRRGPKRTFLLGLFITDLWFLWNRLIIQIGSRLWDGAARGPDLYGYFYKVTAGIWLYLESVLFFASQWTLMAFCVDRYLAIRCPLHHRTNYRRNSLFAVAFIFVCSAVNALNVPVFYYWMLGNDFLAPGAVVPQFPKVFQQWRRMEMWWEVFVRLLAYVGTATLNMLIIARLHQSNIQVDRAPIIRTMTAATDSSGSRATNKPSAKHGAPIIPRPRHSLVRRTNSSQAANKILIASSFFFLLTQSLDFGMSVLLAFSQAPICLFQITNTFLQVYDPFRAFLVNMYFACGFMFYLCCGEQSLRGLFVSSRVKRLSVVESLIPMAEMRFPLPIIVNRSM
ncbi:hypothetical protein BV898_01709 [Hypsibius exemplaris]|uniref:G-protein coupled receptors family 1 profile domain-containing protein n=1 Tax=Hypsibius exemplaris TaxID=2072580 RepID=A0A1W0XB49_HYPEX|nr:hypothetical protein BV898_01709 [Hypsibius exemplaris]